MYTRNSLSNLFHTYAMNKACSHENYSKILFCDASQGAEILVCGSEKGQRFWAFRNAEVLTLCKTLYRSQLTGVGCIAITLRKLHRTQSTPNRIEHMRTGFGYVELDKLDQLIYLPLFS